MREGLKREGGDVAKSPLVRSFGPLEGPLDAFYSIFVGIIVVIYEENVKDHFLPLETR